MGRSHDVHVIVRVPRKDWLIAGLAYAVAVHAGALLILSLLPSVSPWLKLLAHSHLMGTFTVLGAIAS